jgi:kinesin family protein 2/24
MMNPNIVMYFSGRVHSAMVSKLNPAARSVTVEWYERGETKGKEVELDMLLALNPELITSNTRQSFAPVQPQPTLQQQQQQPQPTPINLQRVSSDKAHMCVQMCEINETMAAKNKSFFRQF